MTENQQKIIDSLIAEFNSRNEKTSSKSGGLIDLEEIDAINQRHRLLTADAECSKKLWEQQRREYIDNLVEQIKEEIGHRLCVERGDIATEGTGWSNYIFIYEYGTSKHLLNERALRFNVALTSQIVSDKITNKHYEIYNGFILKRYVTPNSEEKYKDEVEFFNCKYTKNALKDLLA
jgi:hypothetical protein